MRHSASCDFHMGAACNCGIANDVVSKHPDATPDVRRQLARELTREFSWDTSVRIVGLIEIFIEEKMRGN